MKYHYSTSCAPQDLKPPLSHADNLPRLYVQQLEVEFSRGKILVLQNQKQRGWWRTSMILGFFCYLQ